MTMVITIFTYGKYLLPMRLSYILCYFLILPMEIILIMLIIAARNHYSVDVIVALYVTPLWYYASYYFVKDEPNVNNINYTQINDEESVSEIDREDSQSFYVNY